MPGELDMAVFARDGWRCRYCGIRVRLFRRRRGVKVPDDAATIDHLVPAAKGGPTTKGNTVTACYRCNMIKADNELPLEELSQQRRISNWLDQQEARRRSIAQ